MIEKAFMYAVIVAYLALMIWLVSGGISNPWRYDG